MIGWLRGGLVGAGGIGAVARTRTLSGVNHLQMVWDSAAMSQVATWLN